jgi:hypothetical protein
MLNTFTYNLAGLLLFFLPGILSAQFYGGIGDGVAGLQSAPITLNQQVLYCSGGNADGSYSLSSGNIYMSDQSVYCNGGNADGAGSGSFTGIMFNSAPYCSGGNADGASAATTAVLLLNDQSLYCSGGNADGSSASATAVLLLNNQSLYCSGGNGDGAVDAAFTGSMFDAVIYCSGGSADGSSSTGVAALLSNQSLYCSGGNADGSGLSAMTSFTLGSGIWKGTLSSDWSTAGNWTNSTVPDATINVVIPAGCPNYPALAGTMVINSASGTYRAQRLDILDGASLANTGTLSLYGPLNVSGMYIANNTTSASQNIRSGGMLTIEATGSVKIGNQSSGSGFCDLIVNSGGTLTVSGGLLDVDDQLDILSGGAFNMTSGTVFAHRYGLGSSYNVSYPGSFYVASGASGSISGGFIKVAGKATVSSDTAVSINSAAFDFTGTSSLVFTDGVNITDDNVECRAVTSATFRNLLVDRPGRIITIGSDAIFSGDVTINPACTLMVKPGMNVTVNGNLNILQ